MLLLEAIRRKKINVQDADGYKAILAANSYTLSFNSFADLL
jgi:hypothetical protein